MRDYLLRLIEQFGMFWARIVHFRQTAQHTAALAEIDQTYSRLFGRRAQFIDLLDDEGVLQLAHANDAFNPDRAAMLAALHVAEGDCYTELFDSDAAFRRYERALMLYAAIPRHNKSIPREMRENAQSLLKILEHYTLDAPMLDDAWRLYAAFGQFANAEDHAWQWLEAIEFEPASVREAFDWYTHLATLSDQQLVDGGLSRAEVVSAQTELQAKGYSVPVAPSRTTAHGVTVSRVMPDSMVAHLKRKR